MLYRDQTAQVNMLLNSNQFSSDVSVEILLCWKLLRLFGYVHGGLAQLKYNLSTPMITCLFISRLSVRLKVDTLCISPNQGSFN